jgi:hypothetical protein
MKFARRHAHPIFYFIIDQYSILLSCPCCVWKLYTLLCKEVKLGWKIAQHVEHNKSHVNVVGTENLRRFVTSGVHSISHSHCKSHLLNQNLSNINKRPRLVHHCAFHHLILLSYPIVSFTISLTFSYPEIHKHLNFFGYKYFKHWYVCACVLFINIAFFYQVFAEITFIRTQMTRLCVSSRIDIKIWF